MKLFKHHPWLFKVGGITLVAAILLILANTLPLAEWFQSFFDWVDDLGAWGPLIFILVYVISVVCLAPGWLLTVGAGFTFGILKGDLYCTIGATGAATVSFLIGRHLARRRVERFVRRHKVFRAVDEAIERQGFRILLFIRMSPLVPYNLSNYIIGLTNIRLREYVLATMIGMQPGNFLLLYLGAVGRLTLTEREITTPQIVYMVCGLIFTVGVTIWVTILSRRALRESQLEEALEKEAA